MDQYLSIPRGQTSVILRVKIRDTSDNNGAGKTGLAFNTANNIISVIASNGAVPIASYTTAGGTIETITTLGTYAAPTATKCRFKEVDATNHPGLYEIQLADAVFATASARHLTLTITGAADAEQTDVQIQLTSTDNPVAADAVMISGDSAAADNAESYFDGTGYGDILQRTTAAVVTDQDTFTLTAGSADNDAYNGCTVVIQDQSTAAQKCIGYVADYVGASKTVQLAADPGVFTFVAGDIVTILSPRATQAAIEAALDGAVLQITGNTFKGTAVISIP